MADNARIIANTENIEQVVLTFSSQLDDYIEKMTDDVSKLRNAVIALREGWTAEDYNDFQQNIEEKMVEITHELDTAKSLKGYLEEAAAQIKDFLDTLRAAGSK